MKRFQNIFSAFLCLVVVGWSVLAFARESGGADAGWRGLDVRDSRAAVSHYLPLAEKNDPHAQYILGRMYATGNRVEKDYLEAYVWLHLAEMNGVTDATELKHDVRDKMTRRMIAQAHRRIDYWQQHYRNQDRLEEVTSPMVIHKVQRFLAQQGLYAGKLDGIMGERTRGAIRRYQQRNLYTVDGRLTPSLLHDMGLGNSISPSHGHHVPANMDDDIAENELRTLKDELRKISREARRDGAAPWLIRKLEQLASMNSGEWGHLVLRNRFSAHDYSGGEGWQVEKGNFYPEPGRGLVATGGSSWGTTGNQPADLATTLLEILMNGEHGAGNRNIAMMVNDVSFGGAFALRVQTGSFESTDGLVFSADKGDASQVGYKMVFHPKQEGKAKVFEILGNNAREIITHAKPAAIDSRPSHTIVWTRSSSGEMVVSVDGEELLRVKTGGDTRSFDTLGITHIGERIVIEDIELSDNRQAISRF